MTFAVTIFLSIAAAFCLSRAADRGLSHDEHQFIAPAILWARHGLLPYRDVALFHQPYLVAIYAAVGGWTEHPLLMMRLVSAAAAMLTGGLLFGFGWLQLQGESPWKRLFLPAAVVLLWLSSDLFLKTSGLTWNHDLPSLLVLAAALLALGRESWKNWLLAGVLAGVAIGCRLTFAPFALALAALPLLWPGWSWAQRLRLAASCAAGVCVSLLPSLWLCWLDPEAYWFGNFVFPRLPLLDPENARILKTLSPLRKLRFLGKEILLPNWPLLLLFLTIALPDIWRRWRNWREFQGAALLLLLAALLAGCFAPSRYEEQHFYVLAPFVALVVSRALPGLQSRLLLALTALLIPISVAQNWPQFETLTDVLDYREWRVSSLHREALDLRRAVGVGPVLTLAPILPLEGGLDIYPELATGPFGFRFAGLVEPGQRARMNLWGRKDLTTSLKHHPPAAVLTGFEAEKVEAELDKFSKKNHFVETVLAGKGRLWLPPRAEAP